MEISMRKRTLTVVEAVPEIRLDRLLHRVAQRLYCFTATGSRRPWRGACRRAATVALRQTSRYMTAAIMKAVSASNAECRLMNMVDRMMEMHSTRDAVFTPLLPARALLCAMAKCAPSELYTWMLGQRFVGVSAKYNPDTILVKMLSRGMTKGLKYCPLGQSVETSRKMVIPVNRKAHALK